MYLIKNRSTDPAFNLALEEYFLSQAGEYFCFWRNRPTVVIGRNQDAAAEVDIDFLRKNGITLVRRMSGGGAVFHDLGNVNFSYIVPCEKTDFFNFSRFAAPVISALASLGVNVEATGRNDLLLDGAKISGNAQYLHHGMILHHGTLLFDSDFSYMQGALRVDERKLKPKGITSVKSRVTNIAPHCAQKLTAEEFIAAMEAHITQYFPDIAPYELTESDISGINALADSKYRTDAWSMRRSGNYAFRNSVFLPCGIITVGFDAENGIISGMEITGDFFGIKDVSLLAAKLCGVSHTRAAINQALSETDVSEYIRGCGSDEFAALLF